MAKRDLIGDLKTELVATQERAEALQAAINALAEIPFPRRARGRPRKAAGGEVGTRRRKRRRVSAAQRRAQSARMKAYWKARKAK